MKSTYFYPSPQDSESELMIEDKDIEPQSLEEFQETDTNAETKTKSYATILFTVIIIIFLFTFSLGWSKNELSDEQAQFLADAPYWDPMTPKPSLWKWSISMNNGHSSKNTKEIPNIVHFVRQINRDQEYRPKGHFKIEFRHLLAYYSAHIYLKPERIYFWTDTPQEMLDEARVNGNHFTKALFRIPNLDFRQTIFPNVTAKGVPINAYAHRSDFVRTRVMAKMGGQYFDDDSWVLRDLTPLRQSGFDNILGLETDERIAQAAWLSTPMNPLMLSFARLQETVFNGEWIKASNELITSLMVHYSRLPGGRSSLTLEKNAFFPGLWSGDGLKLFYDVHDFDPNFVEPAQVEANQNITETYQPTFDWGWRKDWRRTWIIHGWSHGLREGNAYMMFKEYKGFTPAYILSRRSNIARALYPALRNMLDSGFLQLDPQEYLAPKP